LFVQWHNYDVTDNVSLSEKISKAVRLRWMG